MLQGSCLCGQVKYQHTGSPQLINNCHCSMCRKAHGAAYGSFLHAKAMGFMWLCGKELLRTYQSSPGAKRAFCSVCGSNMPVLDEQEDDVTIPAGTLDTDPKLKPCVHIFVGSKAPWHDITDSLEQFDAFPPPAWIKQALSGSQTS